MDFTSMNGPQLVAAYNEMAAKLADVKPVKRFATSKDGIKRCEELAKRAGNSAPTLVVESKTVETEMAKKAKTTKAKKEKAPKVVKVSANKLAAEFGARVGSIREKLIIAFDEGYKKMVPTKTLLKACYGSMNTENTGPMKMVMSGMMKMIQKGKLPYELKREKNAEKELCFGLYPKS